MSIIIKKNTEQRMNYFIKPNKYTTTTKNVIINVIKYSNSRNVLHFSSDTKTKLPGLAFHWRAVA